MHPLRLVIWPRWEPRSPTGADSDGYCVLVCPAQTTPSSFVAWGTFQCSISPPTPSILAECRHLVGNRTWVSSKWFYFLLRGWPELEVCKSAWSHGNSATHCFAAPIDQKPFSWLLLLLVCRCSDACPGQDKNMEYHMSC